MGAVAGAYPERRHRRGAALRRRRSLPRLIIEGAVAALLYLVLAFWVDNDFGWFTAGLLFGIVIATALLVWMLPLEQVLLWARGTDEVVPNDAARSRRVEDPAPETRPVRRLELVGSSFFDAEA